MFEDRQYQGWRSISKVATFVFAAYLTHCAVNAL